ncbi:MAG: two-component response regulator [Myxococcales bacterium]|nr:two-component response regulator [Myxococcales bacterium]
MLNRKCEEYGGGILHVVMVEDNELNAELACDLLELAGHRVTVVGDGTAFRALVEQDVHVDIFLLDLLLPDADGRDLLRELRTRGRHEGVPAVALTAQALRGDAERLLDEGFDAVLNKPIDTRSFAAAVAKLAASGRRR